MVCSPRVWAAWGLLPGWPPLVPWESPRGIAHSLLGQCHLERLQAVLLAAKRAQIPDGLRPLGVVAESRGLGLARRLGKTTRLRGSHRSQLDSLVGRLALLVDGWVRRLVNLPLRRLMAVEIRRGRQLYGRRFHRALRGHLRGRLVQLADGDLSRPWGPVVLRVSLAHLFQELRD